jgi:hypothetical protein
VINSKKTGENDNSCMRLTHRKCTKKYSGRYSYQTWKSEKAVQNKTTKYDIKTNKLDYKDENETSLIEQTSTI